VSTIIEPLYLVTRKRRRKVGARTTLATLLLTELRKEATVNAAHRALKGSAVTVYECKIVEVHNPTLKAERKKRLRKAKSNHS
jgi:hypothetical protein